jgi:hypothetical protein
VTFLGEVRNMIALEQEVEELKTRLTRLEATVRHLVGDGGTTNMSAKRESLDSAQILAGLQEKGLIRIPTAEEQRLAAEWDRLPEKEKQAHIRFMHELVLDPLLSDIIAENRGSS